MSTATLRDFSKKLEALPTVLAHRVAEQSAPGLTALAKRSFDGSQTPYGVPWAPSVDGDTITLRKTGALEAHVYYVAIGTKLRVSLGVPYAKYQIGKRPVFPIQAAALPKDYRAVLVEKTNAIAKEHMRGAA